MTDIFDNKIVCKKCNKEMKKDYLVRDGFKLRTVKCEKCGDKIIHPTDLEEYKKFSNLKRKNYKVKMRIVGNSYAISIPKEIVEFIKEQEKIMDNMVKLCFNDARKLSLFFGRGED